MNTETKRWLCAALIVLGTIGCTQAQPFDVRAWYASGQVFVVWRQSAAPANPTDTVEIYMSETPQVSIAGMQRVGRLFFPEYTGARLQELQANARLTVPAPGGQEYQLAADEGVFVLTPHAAGSGFFAVVATGSSAVVPANSDSTSFNYDPVSDPVTPHRQLSGVTPGGHPYEAYALWADGRDDHDDARPDVPVLANRAKNGVPHVFTVTYPPDGLPPAQQASCLFAIHGGGGEYELFRPGIPARANLSLELDDGIVVTPDDSIFYNNNASLLRVGTAWFGYVPEFDPFLIGQRTSPPSDSVVINYTQRRVHWILDWLLGSGSPVEIDSNRVAMIGHSDGGRGASHLTRLRPERFCAAVVYTPASDLLGQASTEPSPLRGTWDSPLDTNVAGPDGAPLTTTELFTMTTRISASHRDLPLTRVYFGKRDDQGAATWSPTQRAVLDDLNDSRLGIQVFWDEREHGVEKWDNETDDATDGYAGPWPDVGQWIAPIRTRRPAGQSILNALTAPDSYPGLFNSDEDPAAVGRQPDPGDGDPNLGDAWGTWGGWIDWDTGTIVDTADRWECTLFLTGLSLHPVDNASVSSLVADIIPRRTRNFSPPEHSRVRWNAVDPSTGVIVQTGVAVAESEGPTPVTGLVIPRDPERVRLELEALCHADVNLDGSVTPADFSSWVAAFNAQAVGCDQNLDGQCLPNDFASWIMNFNEGCG